MIKITNKGFKTDGVYVGRPSVWGNPYPVKKSKYGKKVYSLKESLRLYRQYFERNLLDTEEFKKLVEEYRNTGYLKLNCWCINRTIRSKDDIDLENCRCHAEIIAWYILNEAGA